MTNSKQVLFMLSYGFSFVQANRDGSPANGERPYLIAPIVRPRMSWQDTMMLDIFFGICVQKEQKKDEQNLAE